MKDFDFNKISKEMPYKAPSKDFFEDFTTELLAKVEPKPKMQFSLRRVLTPLCGIAAAVCVILTITLHKDADNQFMGDRYIISDNIDDSIDSFFSALSDEDISYLAAESSYYEDFYANLPN